MKSTRVMPAQKPGLSRQDYETPVVFLDAVMQRFDVKAFTADLAASPSNAKAVRFFTEESDSLKQDWTTLHEVPSKPVINLWLNPPFGHIEPWAKKCAESVSKQGNVRIFFLTVFPSATCATALVERVVHHADIVKIDGKSYRLRESEDAANSRRASRREKKART